MLGDLTDGRGPDAVIDAVSSATSMARSADVVRPGGTVSWVGMEVFLGAPEIAWDQCFMRNLTIRGGVAPVKRYLPELWPLLERGCSIFFAASGSRSIRRTRFAAEGRSAPLSKCFFSTEIDRP